MPNVDKVRRKSTNEWWESNSMSSNFSLQPHRAFAQLTNATDKCQKEVSAGIACTPGQLRAVLQVSTAEHLHPNPLHLARPKQQRASKWLGVNRTQMKTPAAGNGSWRGER